MGRWWSGLAPVPDSCRTLAARLKSLAHQGQGPRDFGLDSAELKFRPESLAPASRLQASGRDEDRATARGDPCPRELTGGPMLLQHAHAVHQDPDD